MNNKKKLLLASKSPRRLHLLGSIVPEDRIVVIESNIEERYEPGENAETFCERVARKKAAAVWRKYEGVQEDIAAVIGADTVIWYGKHIIGQPKDAIDAMHILRELSGNCHEVITGVAVFIPSCARFITFVVRSKVWMRKVDEKTIEEYAATGEPMDKAGAYAIQGKGRVLVAKYEGSYSNIVGLPIEELKKVLEGVIS
ncbi:MAG: Maf family protein [candidate division WOR-3 bacterium]|nr:Maf family protein [candidate division WOR-3 bacterium]